jgi:hypothetical protein
MLISPRTLDKKLLTASVREAIALSICSVSMGIGCGIDMKSLTSMVSSRSNHGRCFHRVDKTLVFAAVNMSSLSRMDDKISSVSMLSLSSSSDFCNITYESELLSATSGCKHIKAEHSKYIGTRKKKTGKDLHDSARCFAPLIIHQELYINISLFANLLDRRKQQRFTLSTTNPTGESIYEDTSGDGLSSPSRESCIPKSNHIQKQNRPNPTELSPSGIASLNCNTIDLNALRELVGLDNEQQIHGPSKETNTNRTLASVYIRTQA